MLHWLGDGFAKKSNPVKALSAFLTTYISNMKVYA
jgi:hypothetical protein